MCLCVRICAFDGAHVEVRGPQAPVFSFHLVCRKVSCLANLDSRLVGLLTSGEFGLCLLYSGVGVQTHTTSGFCGFWGSDLRLDPDWIPSTLTH